MNLFQRAFYRCLVVSTCLMLSTTLAWCEDDPELTAAQTRVKILQTRLQELQAQRDIEALNIPKLDYTVDKTKFSYSQSDKTDIHTTIQGYRSLSLIFRAVAKTFRDSASPSKEKFVYVTTSDPAKLREPAEILNGLKQIEDSYKASITIGKAAAEKPEPQAGLGAAFTLIDSVLGSGAKLLSYFKNEVNITTTTVNIDKSALSFKAWSALHSDVSPKTVVGLDNAPNLTGDESSPVSDALLRFNNLRDSEEVISLKKKLQKIADYKAPSKDGEKVEWSAAKIKQAKEILARMTALETLFDAVQKVLLTPDASGVMPVSKFAHSEQILAKLKSTTTDNYVLYLTFVQSGGTVRSLQGPFNLGSISYSGGSVVGYVLFRPDGSIVSAGVEDAIKSYQRVLDGDGYINGDEE